MIVCASLLWPARQGCVIHGCGLLFLILTSDFRLYIEGLLSASWIRILAFRLVRHRRSFLETLDLDLKIILTWN